MLFIRNQASLLLIFLQTKGHTTVPNYNQQRIQIHGGGKMDKDRIKGAVDDTAGRVKRQVGEWTGDTKTQAEGAAQQVKGKAEKAWGNLKDAARDVNARASEERASNQRNTNEEREAALRK
jgi:uncharacterized protein YjbJ (UPF0337 family)